MARPWVELVVIPRSAEVVTAEEQSSLALIALIGVNRSATSPAQLRELLM